MLHSDNVAIRWWLVHKTNKAWNYFNLLMEAQWWQHPIRKTKLHTFDLTGMQKKSSWKTVKPQAEMSVYNTNNLSLA